MASPFEGDVRFRRARVTLKSPHSMMGAVDGGWWPRTRDLAAELVPLVNALDTRVRRLVRIEYRTTDWLRPPATIVVGGRVVRLDGHAHQLPATLRIAGTGAVLVLAIIAPETVDEQARLFLSRAADSANVESASTLSGPVPPDRSRVAQQFVPPP